ncbi:unnamed protein product, partial [marine sediment metagenome]
MCGIAGIIKLRGQTISDEYIEELVRELLIASEIRGDDATGIAVINTELDKTTTMKGGQKASDFVESKEWSTFKKKFKKGNIILLHTRSATQGSAINNNNNHPFTSKKTHAVLIHNGIIHNDRVLEEEYKIGRDDSEVDSEIILLLYDLFLDMTKVIKKIRGSMGMALYHNKHLYLYRNTPPVTVAFLPTRGIIVFASTEGILRNALGECNGTKLFGIFKKVEKYYKYDIPMDTLLDFNVDTESFKQSTVESKQYGNTGGYYNTKDGVRTWVRYSNNNLKGEFRP